MESEQVWNPDSGSDVGCEGLPALLAAAKRVGKGGSCLSWPLRWFSDATAPQTHLALQKVVR